MYHAYDGKNLAKMQTCPLYFTIIHFNPLILLFFILVLHISNLFN